MTEIQRSYTFTINDGSRYRIEVKSSFDSEPRFTLYGPKYTPSGLIYRGVGFLSFEGEKIILRFEGNHHLPLRDLALRLQEQISEEDREILSQ